MVQCIRTYSYTAPKARKAQRECFITKAQKINERIRTLKLIEVCSNNHSAGRQALWEAVGAQGVFFNWLGDS